MVSLEKGAAPANIGIKPETMDPVIFSPNQTMANNVEDNRFPEFRRECIGAAIKLSTDKEATL